MYRYRLRTLFRDPHLIAGSDRVITVDSKDEEVDRESLIYIVRSCKLKCTELHSKSRSYYKAERIWHCADPVVDAVRMYISQDGFGELDLSDFLVKVLSSRE